MPESDSTAIGAIGSLGVQRGSLMQKQFYLTAAIAVLILHLAWIAFVIFGWIFTKGRPKLTALHLASLVWGIVVETAPLPCPLTLVENFFEIRAGRAPETGGFLLYCLDRTVYPDVSATLLTICAVLVCAVIFAIYIGRWRCHRQRVEKI